MAVEHVLRMVIELHDLLRPEIHLHARPEGLEQIDDVLIGAILDHGMDQADGNLDVSESIGIPVENSKMTGAHLHWIQTDEDLALRRGDGFFGNDARDAAGERTTEEELGECNGRELIERSSFHVSMLARTRQFSNGLFDHRPENAKFFGRRGARHEDPIQRLLDIDPGR